MCDCYAHKCELCNERVDIHIADFRYPRDAIMVWCGHHVDHARPGSVVFQWKPTRFEPIGRCAMFGPAVGLEKGNHPNLASDMTEESVGMMPSLVRVKHAGQKLYADTRHWWHGVTWRIWWRRKWDRKIAKEGTSRLGMHGIRR